MPLSVWTPRDVGSTQGFTVERGALSANVDANGTEQYPRLEALAGQDLHGVVFTLTLRDLPPAGETAFLGFASETDQGWQELWIESAALISGSDDLEAVSLEWDPATERVLRMRDSGGDQIIEVSVDGASFDERYRRASRSFMDRARVQVGATRAANHAAWSARLYDDVRVHRGACDSTCIPTVEEELSGVAVGPAFTAWADGGSVEADFGTYLVSLPAGASGASVFLTDPVDARGMSWTVWLSTPPSEPETSFWGDLRSDELHTAYFEASDQTLVLAMEDAAPAVSASGTFTPGVDVFFRLTASVVRDQLVLETSTDGVSFVERLTLDGLPSFLADTYPGFGAGRWVQAPADEVRFNRVTLIDEGCD